MRLFNHARALCAALLACGMAWFAQAPGAHAGPLGEPANLRLVFESSEPFGLAATPIYYGGLRSKWLGVAHKLEDERAQLAICDGNRENCAAHAALKFLAILGGG